MQTFSLKNPAKIKVANVSDINQILVEKVKSRLITFMVKSKTS
jgi:hypothetical protein